MKDTQTLPSGRILYQPIEVHEDNILNYHQDLKNIVHEAPHLHLAKDSLVIWFQKNQDPGFLCQLGVYIYGHFDNDPEEELFVRDLGGERVKKFSIPIDSGQMGQSELMEHYERLINKFTDLKNKSWFFEWTLSCHSEVASTSESPEKILLVEASIYFIL